MKVYAVNEIHTPWLSHGFEVVALFSVPETANAYAEMMGTKAKEEGRDYQGTPVTYDFDEWVVDDPEILAQIPGALGNTDAPPSTERGE